MLYVWWVIGKWTRLLIKARDIAQLTKLCFNWFINPRVLEEVIDSIQDRSWIRPWLADIVTVDVSCIEDHGMEVTCRRVGAVFVNY